VNVRGDHSNMYLVIAWYAFKKKLV